MSTCREIITDALGEIRTYAAGETSSTDDINLGLSRLQRLINIHFPEETTPLIDESVPTIEDYPSVAEDFFMYELAVRLCGPFGAQMKPEQVMARRRAKSLFLAALDVPADAELDYGLSRIGETKDYDFATGLFEGPADYLATEE